MRFVRPRASGCTKYIRMSAMQKRLLPNAPFLRTRYGPGGHQGSALKVVEVGKVVLLFLFSGAELEDRNVAACSGSSSAVLAGRPAERVRRVEPLARALRIGVRRRRWALPAQQLDAKERDDAEL